MSDRKDSRRLAPAFPCIPVQRNQFHQPEQGHYPNPFQMI